MATKLKDRIKVGLDEIRMIVLVVQVLIGFAGRAVFEPRFVLLPPIAQDLQLISCGLLILALALLLTVPAYQVLAARGEDTPAGERILRRLLEISLVPFAIALSLDVATAAVSFLHSTTAAIIASAVGVAALFFWYGIEYLHGAQQPRKPLMKDENEPTPLDEKIKQVLTECRIVLPGTQALLGFQFIAFLTDSFSKLSRANQLVHLAALLCVALSGILLMTPAAYHRIAEGGEMTAHFHRLASRLLLAAMAPLALGISLDFYIVLMKVTSQPKLSLGCAALTVAVFGGCWFVFPMWRRKSSARAAADVEELGRARVS